MQRFRAAVPKWRIPSRDVRVCGRQTWRRSSKRSGHIVCVVLPGRGGTFGVNTINAGWRRLRKESCKWCFGLLTYPIRRVISNQNVQPNVATTIERRIKIISSMGLLCAQLSRKLVSVMIVSFDFLAVAEWAFVIGLTRHLEPCRESS